MTTTLRQASLALEALADLAPGAEVIGVNVDLGTATITVYTHSQERAEALALATGVAGPPTTVGQIQHPMVKYKGKPAEFPEIELMIFGFVR